MLFLYREFKSSDPDSGSSPGTSKSDEMSGTNVAGEEGGSDLKINRGYQLCIAILLAVKFGPDFWLKLAKIGSRPLHESCIGGTQGS